MHKQWGEDWTWPLKTFPRHQASGPDLTNSYGLVYWPGEEVTVHVTGDDAVVDRLSCTDEVDGTELVAERQSEDGRLWRIRLPARPAAEAVQVVRSATPSASAAQEGAVRPYLTVCRVRAWAAGKEVAARGLIVTQPWSGVRAVPVHGTGREQLPSDGELRPECLRKRPPHVDVHVGRVDRASRGLRWDSRLDCCWHYSQG